MARPPSLYRRIIAWTVVLFFVALLLTALPSAGRRGDDLRIEWGGPAIGLVEIEGTLLASERTVRYIELLAARDEIRALLVKVESPGGAVVASDEIYGALSRAREQYKKPVVAWLGTVAASGGYYIACAADSIIAHPASLTGSIGVIVEYPVFEELFRKIGAEWETITSGEYKSMGSPVERTTQRQRDWFQAVVEDNYQQFTTIVRERRRLPEATLEAYADGRVFTGRQAAAWGFADRTGDFESAKQAAAEMGGLGRSPRLVRIRPEPGITLWDLVFGRAGVREVIRALGLRAPDAPGVYFLMP